MAAMPTLPRGLVNGFVHVLAWSLATGAAVTLSWWGVHTVMTGTAYDPPRALPITAAKRDRAGGPATGLGTGSRRVPAEPDEHPDPDPHPRPDPHEDDEHEPVPRRFPSGQVKSYATDGGRVVLELDTSPAYVTLVSATPGTGWSMQVWKEPSWLRVEFTKGTGKVSVICTWHDGAPRVDVGNY